MASKKDINEDEGATRNELFEKYYGRNIPSLRRRLLDLKDAQQGYYDAYARFDDQATKYRTLYDEAERIISVLEDMVLAKEREKKPLNSENDRPNP